MTMIMTPKRYLGVAALISGAGTAFAGYLSYTRAASGVCAFAEPCPLFLGHPSCYTGLALFAAALLVSLAALLTKTDAIWPLVANFFVGVAGTLFSSLMTRDELIGPASYRLGLPTCAYGMLFFIGLLVWSLSAATLRARRHHPHAPPTLHTI